MLSFTYFVNNFQEKIESCLVFWKHSEKIKVSSFTYTFNSLLLNFYKQCGDCLALRV